MAAVTFSTRAEQAAQVMPVTSNFSFMFSSKYVDVDNVVSL
jgi:hypothetical protein